MSHKAAKSMTKLISQSCVILSQLSACQGKMGPFKDYPSTWTPDRLEKKAVKAGSTFSSSKHICCWCIDVATDGDEKCVLKLCVYKTPFGKSGHIYQLP